MTRTRILIAVAGTLVVLTSVLAAPQKFRLSLVTTNAGNDPFGTGVPDKGRLYAGEPIVASVTGALSGGEPLGIDNDTLIGSLEPCLLAGANHPEIAGGGTLECLQLGIQWVRTGASNSPFGLDGRLVGTGGTIPAGDYTLVVTTEYPDLLQTLGVTTVRSNALVVTIGAPTTEKQILASGLRRANQARADGDWATARTTALQLLGGYDRSVYAWTILGDAELALENEPAALNAFNSALEVVISEADVFSPERTDPATKARWKETLEMRIDGILFPPEED